jgi:hypothetical protein
MYFNKNIFIYHSIDYGYPSVLQETERSRLIDYFTKDVSILGCVTIVDDGGEREMFCV